MPSTAPRVLTVSALNRIIRTELEAVLPEVWVEGEISNLRVPASGHVYLTLKDASSQLRGVLFRSSGSRLTFVPRDGMHVLCRGQVTVYEPRGEYQLQITAMEPRGAGALQLAFEQLKERLRKEGLFDPARKRPLPLLPRRIGIVTSPTGAAIRDILKILRRRFSNLHVVINPVPVQGEGAAEAIASAIGEFNAPASAEEEIDVLIVTRGGGSIEDLWAFNEEVVARAVAASRVPVISAVGHEVDYTIVDFVADLRAPTPSAAAERVVQSKRDMIEGIDSRAERLGRAVRALLSAHRASFRQAAATLRDPQRTVQAFFLRLDELESRIRSGIQNTLRHHQKKFYHLQDILGYESPVERFRRAAVSLEHGLFCLKQSMAFLFKTRRARLEEQLGRLDSLSPLAILNRGYSLAYRWPEGRLLKSAGEVARGDAVYIRLHRGALVCGVNEVRAENHGPSEV